MNRDTPTFTKDAVESGLRLVTERAEITESTSVEKQFVNFMFMRVSPEWRRIAPDKKSVGSSRVDLQACKLEYSIVSPK